MKEHNQILLGGALSDETKYRTLLQLLSSVFHVLQESHHSFFSGEGRTKNIFTVSKNLQVLCIITFISVIGFFPPFEGKLKPFLLS